MSDRPFSSQDERDAFRESLPASDMFVVPTSEVRMLLDALDAAERRAADAEADATAIRSLAAQCEAQWSEPGRTVGEIVTAAVMEIVVAELRRVIKAMGAAEGSDSNAK